MNDEQILERGGEEKDIAEYARSNGANLTKDDVMYEATRERVAQIIGEASMLWTETPTGTFKSQKAKELVNEVMAHLQYPLEHPNDQRNTCERCGVTWGYIHNCQKIV